MDGETNRQPSGRLVPATQPMASTPGQSAASPSGPQASPGSPRYVEVDGKYAGRWDGGLAVVVDDSDPHKVTVCACLDKRIYVVSRKGVKEAANIEEASVVEPGSGQKRRSGRDRKPVISPKQPEEADKPVPSSARKPAGKAKPTGLGARQRQVKSSDVGKRVEVYFDNGDSGWYGGTIQSFAPSAQTFEVQYDDGSVENERVTEKTFFPDPAEEARRYVHPAGDDELVMIRDPDDPQVPMVGRVLGARPGGEVRVAFVGWMPQNDTTIGHKPKQKQGKGYHMMAEDPKRLRGMYTRLVQVYNEKYAIASNLVGSTYQGQNQIKQVAIRQPTGEPKGRFAVWLQLQSSDDVWWVQEGDESPAPSATGEPRRSSPKKRERFRTPIAVVQVEAAAPRKAGSASGQQQPAPVVLPALPYLPAYEEDFDDLQQDERDAAAALGWSRQLWEDCGPPPSRQLAWTALKVEQQTAAVVLGWSECSWNKTAPPAERADENRLQPCALSVREPSVAWAVHVVGMVDLRLGSASMRQEWPVAADSARRYGSQAQSLEIEWDDVLEERSGLPEPEKLLRFLHVVSHNAELGLIPTRSIYQHLVAQLTSAPKVQESTTSEFSQDLHGDSNQDEDEEAQERQQEADGLAKQARRCNQIIYTVLQVLLVRFRPSRGGCESSWSAVSDKQNSGQACPEDFERFDGNLGRVVLAVRPALVAGAAVPHGGAAGEDAILFLDYAASVLCQSDQMLRQLLRDSDPQRSEAHCEQVIKRCVSIVGAAAASTGGGGPSHALAVAAAQRLLSCVVVGSGLLKPKTALTTLKQLYSVELGSARAKQLFVEVSTTSPRTVQSSCASRS